MSRCAKCNRMLALCECPVTTKAERDIQAEILLALGQKHDLTIWRQNTGKLMDRTGRWIQVSVPGISDICGIVEVRCRIVAMREHTPYGDTSDALHRAYDRELVEYAGPVTIGRFFGLECKTQTGKQRTDQSDFEKMVRRHGGFYRLVRSVEEAITAYHSARQGEP